MSRRQHIDFDRVQLEVLVLLHERFVADLPGVSIAEIAGEIAIARNVVRLVIREEIGRGFCREDYKGPVHPLVAIGAFIAGQERYLDPDLRLVEITRSGIEWVGSLDDAVYRSALEKFGGELSGIVGIPASDRTVTLNHNQPEYKEAVEALDKAIGAFDQDHCLDNEFGPEKAVLKKGLEVARDYIKLKEINARIGMALIVEQLEYIANKYENAIAGAALGQIFRVAVDKVMALLN